MMMGAAATATSTPARTPARGRSQSRSRVRVRAPPRSGRSGRGRGQESDGGGSSRADSVKAAPAVPVTPASGPRRSLRSDAKPRSTGKATATSPPSSPSARGRKPPSSLAKMDSVEILVTRSRSATRSRVRGSGAETGDEKAVKGTAVTEGKVRKRRKVAYAATS
jgi:hypothetical protein